MQQNMLYEYILTNCSRSKSAAMLRCAFFSAAFFNVSTWLSTRISTLLRRLLSTMLDTGKLVPAHWRKQFKYVFFFSFCSWLSCIFFSSVAYFILVYLFLVFFFPSFSNYGGKLNCRKQQTFTECIFRLYCQDHARTKCETWTKHGI